ncbi:MAG: AAA family ATPase [Candidatus Izemoplasmataceae bacterium]
MKHVLIITGQLASLKTTIAKRLATDLKALLLCKDDLKEALAKSIKTKTREENKTLSQATFNIMHEVLKKSLIHNHPVIVEGNFKADEYNLLKDSLNHMDITMITLYLHGNIDELYSRYLNREKSRHDTHKSIGTMNKSTFSESMDYYEGVYGTLKSIMKIDTTVFKEDDYQALKKQLKETYGLKIF